MKKTFSAVALGAILLLVLGGSVSALAQAQQPPRPPEYNEVAAAQKIADQGARLKEFERIKAAYPQSTLMSSIDGNIYGLKLDLASTLDAILALQKDRVGKGQGFAKLASFYTAAMDIVTHANLSKFDKSGVLRTVQAYQEEAEKLLRDQAYIQTVSEAQKRFLAEFGNNFQIGLAMALLHANDAVRAMAALEAYKAAGGAPNVMFSYTFAEAAVKLNKNAEALDGYMSAAVENYEDAAAKAQAAWIKVNGKEDGFAAALEAKQKELPYHPAAFKAPADWNGKTVLAEIFTGSECPPCVAADLGFDGLIESVPGQYLAILEYHRPIPRPDPIMNPATGARQKFYGVNSTPSTFFDGEAKLGGGGGRANAENKYNQYLAEITPRLSEAPATTLKAKAALSGDSVKVDVTIDKPAAGAEVHVVLVQNEVPYKGSNGIVFHKLVVRDIRTVTPEAPQAVFDLTASEKAADAYLTEFEKTYTRIPNFKWAERHFKISRTGLKVVVFAQDPQTKKVHNAVTVDVK
jgi:thiol-disulfide isomerase/thioredoxin